MVHIPGKIEVSFCPTSPETMKELPKDSKYFDTFDEVKEYYGSEYDRITYICCTNCNLDKLPELPVNLHTLYCCWNNLKELPKLPSTLQQIHCGTNQLKKIPNLPEGLKIFCGSNNYYRSVMSSQLPKSLTKLSICNNEIDHIDDLSELSVLKSFHCSYCELTNMPNLPESLELLMCDYNQLDSLTNLPSGLKTLSARNNKLTKIELPEGIGFVDVATTTSKFR